MEEGVEIDRNDGLSASYTEPAYLPRVIDSASAIFSQDRRNGETEERRYPLSRWRGTVVACALVGIHTLRCFAAAFVAARSPNEKGSREIGSRPSDCGIGQLSLTFALLRGGARIIPVTRPFFLFVSRIFISFLSFALLFFIARYFASRSSFSFFPSHSPIFPYIVHFLSTFLSFPIP